MTAPFHSDGALARRTLATRRTAAPRLTACAVLLAALPAALSAKDPAPAEPDRPAAKAPATTPTTAPATKPAAADGWRDLFDGKSLKGWKSSEFGGQGEPAVEEGKLVLPVGVGLTGVTYTGGDVPKMNYEVVVEAQRVDGADFFCGLTFPVGDTHASLIVGGWGGSLIGISSLDDKDAAHNETRTNRKLQTGVWYTVRLRVLPDRLVAWLGDDKVVDVDTAGKKIGIRQDIAETKPFGLASWQTTAAVRAVRVRAVKAEETR